MACKEGSGIRFEVTAEVKGGNLDGKIICQELKNGRDEGQPLTEIFTVHGAGEMSLAVLGGRIKVFFMEVFSFLCE